VRTDSETTETVQRNMTIIKNSFAETDFTIPYRFVGSYEYLSALETFIELVELSTPEQIEVYDKLIKDQPEFSYYSGVVSTLGPINLFGASKEERNVFEDKFNQRTLAWLMALCRVELGATMAMYGDNPSPFDAVAPDEFGLEEYGSILYDDLAAHLSAITTDEYFKKILRTGTETSSDTLAYIRRLKIVHDMLLTLKQSQDVAISTKASEYLEEIRRKGRRLMRKVEMAEQDQVSFSENTSIDTRDVTRATGRTTAVGRNGVSDSCKTTFATPSSAGNLVSQ
jgi:hypothetical protein